MNEIFHLNFLENDLPDKCANLIIADPPYFEVKGEFDFKWKTFKDYLKDVERWAKECKRLLADNGSLFWWGDAKKIAYSQIILDKHFNLENSIVWENTNPHKQQTRFSKGLRSFAPVTERCLFYSLDSLNITSCICSIRDYIRSEIMRARGEIVFKEVNAALGTATNGGGVASACLSLDKLEPAMITEEMYLKLRKWLALSGDGFLSKQYEELRQQYEELRQQYEELRRPFDNELNLGDVWGVPNFETSRFSHETIKPEKIAAIQINACSRKNDLVVVPFAGSGTECAMAAKYGRRFVGYDIEGDYVNISRDRVLQHTSQLQLF